MVYCSASVLLQLSLLLHNKARACMKTVQTPPGTRIPPCGQCVTNSFYPTDHCVNPNGCLLIPPDQVTNEIKTPFGCKDTRLACPPDSMVHFTFQGMTMDVTWDEFIALQGGFEKILCDDKGVWRAIFQQNNVIVDRLYCYRLGCASCVDIPIGTDCPQGRTCENPITTYFPQMPGGGVCRTIILFCNAGTMNLYIVLARGETVAIPVADLTDGRVSINCSPEGKWKLTQGAQSRDIVSLSCMR